MCLAAALTRTIRCYDDRRAIVDPARTFTWSEHGDRVARAAAVLARLGLKSGQRYGILAHNSYQQAELIQAGYWMGAVPVPINTRLAPVEIDDILRDAACRLVVVDGDDRLAATEVAAWRATALSLSRDYERSLEREAPAPPRDNSDADDAIILYTGGTTGKSKGVRLTHGNVLAHGMQWAIAMAARPDDVYLQVAPMFHAAGLLGTAYTLLGAAHSYLPRFTPESFLAAVDRNRVTTVVLTPTMIVMTLEDGDLKQHDLSSLRQVFYGGAPMAAKWIVRAAQSFAPAELRQGYGLTETSCVLATLGAEEHRRAVAGAEAHLLNAAGRPLLGVAVRIVDPDDRPLPCGAVGEVAVRGPNVSPGYLNRPVESAAAFRGGWFHTGDMGRMDERGYLYLLDRKKDMIVTGGENVYSAEIESAIERHPKVLEAAVIGVPDERYGEALVAVIVPMPNTSPSTDELIAHCRGKIGGYKIPRRFEFIDQMPKNAMGKILKRELRRTFAGEKVA